MNLVKTILEKEIKKCIDSLDEIVDEHIKFIDNKNSSTKVSDIVNNDISQSVLKKYNKLSTKLIFLNMLADRFNVEK